MTDNVCLSNTVQPALTWTGSDTLTTTDIYMTDSDHWEYTLPPINPDYSWWRTTNNKKRDDDMRYLYEVILVNPKNDTFYANKIIARSETSALMYVYNQYKGGFVGTDTCIPFDDLKTSCRELMSWKKEKSLKKAIETIKEAVE